MPRPATTSLIGWTSSAPPVRAWWPPAIATASSLVLIFPYPEGAFRDTFVMQPGGARGTLLLESQHPDGHWSVFAAYQLRRPQAAATATPAR